VGTNVGRGLECVRAGSNPLRQLLTSAAERRIVDDATASALEVCGLDGFGDRTVGTLSTGQRRLVELARALAGGFRLLLLDEPSSGLDEAETERFGGILQRIVAERDIGILIVEHDMALVMAVCEYLFVLDF